MQFRHHGVEAHVVHHCPLSQKTVGGEKLLQTLTEVSHAALFKPEAVPMNPLRPCEPCPCSTFDPIKEFGLLLRGASRMKVYHQQLHPLKQDDCVPTLTADPRKAPGSLNVQLLSREIPNTSNVQRCSLEKKLEVPPGPSKPVVQGLGFPVQIEKTQVRKQDQRGAQKVSGYAFTGLSLFICSSL